MPLSLKWSESAENDVLGIVSYIKERSGAQIAAAIYERLKARVTPLQDFPGTGRVVPELHAIGIDDIHQVLENPWKIYYKITGEEINVLAVIDGRRNLPEVLFQKLLEGKLQ
jgi:toxin ParE1/3/4